MCGCNPKKVVIINRILDFLISMEVDTKFYVRTLKLHKKLKQPIIREIESQINDLSEIDVNGKIKIMHTNIEFEED